MSTHRIEFEEHNASSVSLHSAIEPNCSQQPIQSQELFDSALSLPQAGIRATHNATEQVRDLFQPPEDDTWMPPDPYLSIYGNKRIFLGRLPHSVGHNEPFFEIGCQERAAYRHLTQEGATDGSSVTKTSETPLDRLNRPLHNDSSTINFDEQMASGQAEAACERDDERSKAPAPKLKKLSKSRTLIHRKDVALVKTGVIQRDDVPLDYNEDDLRKFPVDWVDLGERAIVWRQGVVEIYKMSHRKEFKLAETIPLGTNKARLSLFTPNNFTLCFTVSKQVETRIHTTATRNEPTSEQNDFGTTIYCIQFNSTILATDWYWDLYRSMGGSIPEKLSVHVPAMGGQIVIPVPQTTQEARLFNDLDEEAEVRAAEPFAALTADKAVRQCMAIANQIQNYKNLLEYAYQHGQRPYLVWRRGDSLDWVLSDKALDGSARPWALVAGHALGTRRILATDGLELRMSRAYPKQTIVYPYRALKEPDHFEGYVTKVHPKAANEHLYLANIAQHLLVINASHASLPEPPWEDSKRLESLLLSHYKPLSYPYSVDPDRQQRQGLLAALNMFVNIRQKQEQLTVQHYANDDEQDISPGEMLFRFGNEEKRRVFKLVQAAKGFIDLRDVVRVSPLDHERKSSVVPSTRKHKKRDSGASVAMQDGGAASEQSHRAFEVVLQSGKHVTFRVASEAIRDEWIERLNSSAQYWRARKSREAQEKRAVHEEEAIQLIQQHAGAQGPNPQVKDPFGDTADAYLELAYNWSKITGNGYFTMTGRLFVKKEARARFKQRRVLLIRGRLFFFRSSVDSTPENAVEAPYHPLKGSVDLRHCYVLSGPLCSPWMPTRPSGFDPSEGLGQGLPRLYQDGLMVADNQEDCVFVVWKRPKDEPFDEKGQVMIFLARSKTERDEWIFSINQELNKVARQEYAAEQRLLEHVV